MVTAIIFLLAYLITTNINPWIYSITPTVTGNTAAYEQKQREQLRQQLKVTVRNKEEITEAGQKSIKVELLAENLTRQDIRAFKGALIFRDILRDTLKQLPIKEISTLKAGERQVLIYTLSYDPASDADRRFLNSKLEDLQKVWLPDRILYTDKTVSSLTMDFVSDTKLGRTTLTE